jgi:diadenosine tetraphosphate (Ap4A) HIT family hydrolase
MSDPSCNACSGTWPSSDHFIADLGLSMAYLHEDQFFPGWTVLVFKRHATELFHLAPTERIQLMEEVSRLAKVLTEAFEAKKMNYGLLGNQTPHIHWHLIPRLATDPAPREPVWRIPHDRLRLPAEQLQTTIERIKQRL